MQARKILQAQITKAWKSTIGGSYREQRINSERGLQFYFCKALLEEFNEDKKCEKNRRFLIEPRMSSPDTRDEYCYPDVVIYDTQKIIGIVELKYAPRAKINEIDYRKDMKTLQLAVTHAEKLVISNDRFCGIAKRKNREYSLAKDAVLCWAGVYTGKMHINMPDDALSERLLLLSALTTEGKDPVAMSHSHSHLEPLILPLDADEQGN